MRLAKLGLGLVCLSGCVAAVEEVPPPQMAYAVAPPEAAPGQMAPALPGAAPGIVAVPVPVAVVAGAPAPPRWIGVSPESDAVLASGGDTYVAVWIDVPASEPTAARAPLDLALVVDTSGSMEGVKIEHARAAARALAASLPDGDIVSVLSFSDAARVLAPPARLGPETRPRFLSILSELQADGGTNMAAGLSLGNAQLAEAPVSHPVRRLVLISDGMANVGPSSPAALGAIAEQGLAHGAQVTSMGVGNDYDENTLNAIAVRTNGRLYHLPENKEMASILRQEIDLLGGTVASDAAVVLAPEGGVRILGGDEANLSTPGPAGTLVLPIGTLFRGQRREALVRIHVDPGAAGPRGLLKASLHYRTAGQGGHVQEAEARAESVGEAAIVRARANGRAQAIASVYEANRLKIQAAQQLSHGHANAAEQQLGKAAAMLVQQAAVTADAPTKRRLEKEAEEAQRQQVATKAAATAPVMVQRSQALEINAPAAAPAGR